MPTLPKFANLSWRELFRTTWREAAKTNIANRAAELAFWFLLGLFPMLLSVVSMVSTLSSASDSQAILMKYVGEVLPSAASNLVRQVLAQTAAVRGPGLRCSSRCGPLRRRPLDLSILSTKSMA